MDWIGLSCHKVVLFLITYTICVYALLFYALNGQNCNSSIPCETLFLTVLFGKYQINYMYKFFR